MSNIPNDIEGLSARMIQSLEATLDFIIRSVHEGIRAPLLQEQTPEAIHSNVAWVEIKRGQDPL